MTPDLKLQKPQGSHQERKQKPQYTGAHTPHETVPNLTRNNESPKARRSSGDWVQVRKSRAMSRIVHGSNNPRAIPTMEPANYVCA